MQGNRTTRSLVARGLELCLLSEEADIEVLGGK